MRVLALDTTERIGSVALVLDDAVVDVRAGEASRPHAERLPGEILSLLADHRLTVADVDLFAVAAGPGSFTGLRIGIATIQGLAFVRQRPVAAISALEALAQIGGAAEAPGQVVGAWMDAHRRDVFSALYRVTDAPAFEAARLIELDAAAVGPPAETLARWRTRVGAEAIAAIGDGAALYAGILDADTAVRRLPPAPPLAGVIGRMASARRRAGSLVTAAGVQPLYVRRPDAEVARDAKGIDVSVRRE
jgi:tRNA threonylcarbamoyladenosine biosynthesis protein TsaB